MKKMLPLVVPPITSIPSHANFLALIMQMEEGIEWFCSHYINFYVRKKISPEDFTFEDNRASFIDNGMIGKDYSNLLHHYYIPKEFVHLDIIDFLVDAIDKDYYSLIKLNQFFIKNNEYAYQKQSYLHTTLISGYDLENKKFIISDFYDNKKYNSYELDFNDLKNAYESLSDDLLYKHPIHQFHGTEIMLVKPKPTGYHFSAKHMLALLRDYYNGKDSTGRFFNEAYLYEALGEFEYVYGLRTICQIAEMYVQNEISITALHEIYDHKEGMVYRLKFIQEKYPYLELKEYIETYKKLRDMAMVLRNVAIKFTVTKGNNKNMLDKYTLLQKQEEYILPYLINELEKINNCHIYRKDK